MTSGDSTPTWPEMLGRAAAVAFDTASGTIDWRDSDEDGDQAEGQIDFWFRQPDDYRVDDERGMWLISTEDLLLIRDETGAVQRLRPDSAQVGMPVHPRELIDGQYVVSSLTERHDFSRPRGPATEAVIGGRLGWRFVLDPPPHKPAPLEVVIDDATGVVLEQRSRAFNSWWTLTEFTPDAAVADSMFAFAGEVSETHWAAQEARQERAKQREPRFSTPATGTRASHWMY